MGLLINVTTPSDKMAPNVSPAEVVGESGASDEEVELRNAMERDLFQLTIVHSEIERDLARLEAIDAEEKDEEVKDGQDAESVEDENESEEGNEQNSGSKCGDGVTESGRDNRSNNSRTLNYPMRPDAEDCAFYMRNGSCKFGSNCKFNHPPSRKNKGAKEGANHREENLGRAGRTECKYYLTSGECKYGKYCRHSHGSDLSYKSHIQEFNFLGLPIRTGERECPYYMRTGSCKYGSNCRFHHPEPSAVVGADFSSEYGPGGSLPSQRLSSSSFSSWSSPRAYTETYPFTSVMFPPTKGASTNSEWSQYQAGNYPKSESGLPTPPAFALNNLTTEMNFAMPYNHHEMLLEEYPQRPGEPDCSFFLRTGDCKFKSNCKFHHPKNRISKPMKKSLPPSNKGLAIRPDQPICTFYYRHGFCKYGPACRFNHPSNET